MSTHALAQPFTGVPFTGTYKETLSFTCTCCPNCRRSFAREDVEDDSLAYGPEASMKICKDCKDNPADLNIERIGQYQRDVLGFGSGFTAVMTQGVQHYKDVHTSH